MSAGRTSPVLKIPLYQMLTNTTKRDNTPSVINTVCERTALAELEESDRIEHTDADTDSTATSAAW